MKPEIAAAEECMRANVPNLDEGKKLYLKMTLVDERGTMALWEVALAQSAVIADAIAKVRKEERERCARIADEVCAEHQDNASNIGTLGSVMYDCAAHIAAAIRKPTP